MVTAYNEARWKVLRNATKAAAAAGSLAHGAHLAHRRSLPPSTTEMKPVVKEKKNGVSDPGNAFVSAVMAAAAASKAAHIWAEGRGPTVESKERRTSACAEDEVSVSSAATTPSTVRVAQLRAKARGGRGG